MTAGFVVIRRICQKTHRNLYFTGAADTCRTCLYIASSMEFIALKDVVSTTGNQIVRVRISRIWHHRGGTETGPVKSIHMVLVDNQVLLLF
jgi:hypothetical protein